MVDGIGGGESLEEAGIKQWSIITDNVTGKQCLEKALIILWWFREVNLMIPGEVVDY